MGKTHMSSTGCSNQNMMCFAHGDSRYVRDHRGHDMGRLHVSCDPYSGELDRIEPNIERAEASIVSSGTEDLRLARDAMTEYSNQNMMRVARTKGGDSRDVRDHRGHDMGRLHVSCDPYDLDRIEYLKNRVSKADPYSGELDRIEPNIARADASIVSSGAEDLRLARDAMNRRPLIVKVYCALRSRMSRIDISRRLRHTPRGVATRLLKRAKTTRLYAAGKEFCRRLQSAGLQ